MYREHVDIERLLAACRSLGDNVIELNPDAVKFIREFRKENQIDDRLIDELDKRFPQGFWRYRQQLEPGRAKAVSKTLAVFSSMPQERR